MNTEAINTEKIDKLNALKEQQAKLEQELKIVAEVARNDQKKLDATESAKKYLAQDVATHNERQRAIDIFITEFNKMSIRPELEIKSGTTTLKREPSTYITLETGEDTRWKGEPITEEVEYQQITYKGHIINVEFKTQRGSSRRGQYKMTLPYAIDESYNKAYTRTKTIIDKIDTFVARNQRQDQDKLNLETATAKALKWLSKEIDDRTAICETTNSSYRGYGRHKEWYQFPVIKITFENGNTTIYRPHHADNDNGFTLTLQSFKDTRLDSIKSDPIAMINYLK